jgi:hypothetical protein
MRRIHALLGVQSVVAILVSLNRLGTDLGYLPNEFSLGGFQQYAYVLISVVASYLQKTIEYDSLAEGKLISPEPAFIVGLYLLATSYGDPGDELSAPALLWDRYHQHSAALSSSTTMSSVIGVLTGFVMVNAAIPCKVFPTRKDYEPDPYSPSTHFLPAQVSSNLS